MRCQPLPAASGATIGALLLIGGRAQAATERIRAAVGVEGQV